MHIKHSFLHTKHGFMHTKHTHMLSMHSFMHTYCRKSCIFNNFSVLKTQKCFADYESERFFSKFLLEVEILISFNLVCMISGILITFLCLVSMIFGLLCINLCIVSIPSTRKRALDSLLGLWVVQ